ncbi:hypothetical protein K2Q08_00655 [Patescibacteria group bacterium]|nr:hypothetical protein [Patescibacteria group bacterium]
MSNVHWSTKYPIAMLLFVLALSGCVLAFLQWGPQTPQVNQSRIRIPFSAQLSGVALQPASPSYHQVIRLDMQSFIAEFKGASQNSPAPTMYLRAEHQYKRWCRMLSATFSFIPPDGIPRSTTEYISAPTLSSNEVLGACSSNVEGFYFDVLPGLTSHYLNVAVTGIGIAIVGLIIWLVVCLIFVWGPRSRWQEAQKI